MNVLPASVAVALLLVATASMGAEATTSPQPLTRAQVKQATLQARAAGQLHVGEEPHYPATPPTPPANGISLKKHRHASKANATSGDARP